MFAPSPQNSKARKDTGKLLAFKGFTTQLHYTHYHESVKSICALWVFKSAQKLRVWRKEILFLIFSTKTKYRTPTIHVLVCSHMFIGTKGIFWRCSQRRGKIHKFSKQEKAKLQRSLYGGSRNAAEERPTAGLAPSHWHLLQLAPFTSMKAQKLKMASCLKILSICSWTRRKRILF